MPILNLRNTAGEFEPIPAMIGPQGAQGVPGPNEITEATATPLSGVLVGKDGYVKEGEAGVHFAAAAHTHLKTQITDFPTSLPASDVSAWAKAESKPTYSVTEISNITISATDLTAGSSPLATGALYFVYE